jgi:hypothetical protein
MKTVQGGQQALRQQPLPPARVAARRGWWVRTMTRTAMQTGPTTAR